jgi:hypothetical protein
VVHDEGKTLGLWMALLRTALGFVAASFWYISPFIARDRKKGKFWLDRIFSTHAVRLK